MTGKDPQRKHTNSNEKEGEAIKRKDLLKEDNAATKKIGDLERQGKTHNGNAQIQTKRREKQLRGKTY